MSYYVLGVRFSYFLHKDLARAVMAAVRSVSAEVEREHMLTANRTGSYSATFQLAGIQTLLIGDRSEIWDQGHREGTSLELVDKLLFFLSDGLKTGSLTEEIVQIVFNLLISNNKYPVMWKRILERVLIKSELLPVAVPLLESPEILIAPETTVNPGRLISNSFSKLPETIKQKIESAIWVTTEIKMSALYRDPISERNRLLACIPVADLSERSMTAIAAARSGNKLRENEPSFTIGPFTSGRSTADDWLRRQGVDTESVTNRQLLSAKDALSAFLKQQFGQTIPAEEDIEAVLKPLKMAHTQTKAAKDADDRVLQDVLTSVVGVAKLIVRNKKLLPESVAIQTVRGIVFDAVASKDPDISTRADEQFDRPMWSPTPKIGAAQAITNLISNWSQLCANS